MKRVLIVLAALTGFGVIAAATTTKTLANRLTSYTQPQNGKQSHQLPCEKCEVYPRIPGKPYCKYCERIALADTHKEQALKEHKSKNKSYHVAQEHHKKKGKGKQHGNLPKQKTANQIISEIERKLHRDIDNDPEIDHRYYEKHKALRPKTPKPPKH
jgi:hypothetical protein